MSILEEIGQLNIFYIIIPLIFIIIIVFKIKKKGVKKMEKPMNEPTEIKPIPKPEFIPEASTPIIQPPQFQHGEEILWNRVLAIIIIIPLSIMAVVFAWGVMNDKFGSNIQTTFPQIDLPACKCEVPTIISNCSCGSCICPNVTLNPSDTNVNVYYNTTNSTL